MELDKRLWEIDFLRGIAVMGMIVYHFAYDLDFFQVLDLQVNAGLLWLIARLTASAFILLVGISLSLSYSRLEKRGRTSKKNKKYILRGIRIFLYGLIITVVTRVFLESRYVQFGILHLIGASIIIATLFLDKKYKKVAIAGLIIVATGFFLQAMMPYLNVQTELLLWIGLTPAGYSAVDYFPLLPWSGLVLMGLALGKKIYAGYERSYELKDYSKNRIISFICYIGKKSLFIYFLHQPVIILFLYLLGLGEIQVLLETSLI